VLATKFFYSNIILYPQPSFSPPPGGGMRVGELLVVTRPWSFPMTILLSLVVVLHAAAAGYHVDPWLTLVAIVGSVFLHAAANVLNDYFDYRYGVDRPGAGTTVYRPHPIVAGILSPTATLAYGFAWGLAGLALSAAVWPARPLAPLLGIVGLIVAYAYTGPPFKAKYRGLGELLVYIAWGIIIPLGVFYMATGTLTLPLPLAASLPLALLIVGVLVANNLRDIEADRAAGFTTLATVLGRERTQKLFKALVAAAYTAQVGLAAVAGNPWLLLPLLSIPAAVKVVKALSGREVPANADPLAAQLAFNFALLAIAGYAAALAVKLL
jgi:1,4-dihydroxy-2-naphthoate octaprenyltransferase